MRPREFFWAAAKLAWHTAWHASHSTHLVIVLVVGAGVIGAGLLGWHFREHEVFIVLPFIVLLVFFFCGFVWFLYEVHHGQEAQWLAERQQLRDKIEETKRESERRYNKLVDQYRDLEGRLDQALERIKQLEAQIRAMTPRGQ